MEAYCLMIFNLTGKSIQHNLFNTKTKAEFAEFVSDMVCRFYLSLAVLVLPPNYSIILVIYAIWNAIS